MSYFILIRGPLGSGKSTLSKELANKLNAEVIAIDKILDKLELNEIDEKEGCITTENFIKANEDVLPKVRKYLKNGKIVIFDACFYHKKVIDHLVKNLEFPHHVFTLKVPVEICIERDSKRERSYGKDAAQAVHSLVSRFDHGKNIDVSRSIEEELEDIISHLSKQKKNHNKSTKILRWTARILALAVILFGLPFYFGYGNPLPFINHEYTVWDNLWLTVFPLTFIGLALGWKYEKIGGYLITIPITIGLIFGLVTESELVVHMLVPLIAGILYLVVGYKKF